MRCPKCGYISFDHLDKCLKCQKDIKEASTGLFGSTYNVEAPTYLRFQLEKNSESLDKQDLFADRSAADGDEYLDEELEILVDEAEDAQEASLEEDAEVTLAEGEEEDHEIEIDFSQFGSSAEESESPSVDEEEVEAEAEAELAGQPAVALNIPEELADLSDLSPPAKTVREEAPRAAESDEEVELELANLDLDLSFDDLEAQKAPKTKMPTEAILALEEIDLSEALGESEATSQKKTSATDMDEDLDFTLDLGGLSIHSDLK